MKLPLIITGRIFFLAGDAHRLQRQREAYFRTMPVLALGKRHPSFWPALPTR